MRKPTLTVVAVLAMALTMSACAWTGAVIKTQSATLEEQPAEVQPPATKQKLTYGDMVVMAERCVNIGSCKKILAIIKESDVSGIEPNQLSKYFTRLNNNVNNIASKKLGRIGYIERWYGDNYWPSNWDDRLQAAGFNVDQLEVIQAEAKSILESLNKGEKFWNKRLCHRQKIYMEELMSLVCDLTALLLERAFLYETSKTFATVVIQSSTSLASR